MKTIIEFNLPEEAEEFELAINGSKYAAALHELDNKLRSRIKYAPDDQPDDVTNAYQEIRDALWKIANEYGLDI